MNESSRPTLGTLATAMSWVMSENLKTPLSNLCAVVGILAGIFTIASVIKGWNKK